MLEPSGGLSTHIAGASAGMTQAVTLLGQSTEAPTHGFPCGLSLSCMALGSETACPGSGLCRRTKRKSPGFAFYHLASSLIKSLPLYSTSRGSHPSPPKFKRRGTRLPSLHGRTSTVLQAPHAWWQCPQGVRARLKENCQPYSCIKG